MSEDLRSDEHGPLPLHTTVEGRRAAPARSLAPLGTERAIILGIRILAASVWLTFGLAFKLLDLVPRHTEIVAAVLGAEIARPVTLAIGLAEGALGVWVLSGVRPRLCAAVQTAALLAMNVLEIVFARELLLSPTGMVVANFVFLGLVWFAALRSR